MDEKASCRISVKVIPIMNSAEICFYRKLADASLVYSLAHLNGTFGSTNDLRCAETSLSL